MTRLSPLLSLCLLLSVAACGSSESGDPAKVTYAPVLGVDLTAMNRSESGLYTQDQVVGTGLEATNGRLLEVNYSGWLPDGSLFDTSLGRKPFFFTLGQGRVIRGWDEGLVGMKVGGKRRLVLPSDLAYGEQGNSGIPPNSVLIFDVELLSAR
ncbi:FKBP-type peptidyl-prolyl cis-trans isomerase [Cystobacter fuscus DSM 2262]|uniref:Peptidyl-prolyl cis-trans isomerase n=1 Tax=Cystobacter fuscus (strain ATCC 25194 / DSM 2262 / NBRC 100088 / M29) TaxID=1242864 RepID=S9QSI5_CYSF2|nr:FKBP-type peptidyl-prolyl cis-trans isomerase [Cystobacter fuscus]EPX64254.1 FKBP-type peptidyl-prolyl cis-trans isomerase [Cystobacter fuscus DSM 2262]